MTPKKSNTLIARKKPREKLKGLLAYVNVGDGFISPARSVEEGLNNSQKATAELFEFYDVVNANITGGWLKKTWFFCLNHPKLYDLIFFLMNAHTCYPIGYAQSFLVEKKLLKYLKEKSPDFVFSTHFMSTFVLWHVIKKNHLPIAMFAYNSDVILSHQVYITKGVLRYFAPTKECFNDMIRQGMAKNTMCLSEFPIKKAFTKKFPSVSAHRKKMKLKDMPTLLVSFGGTGLENGSALLEGILREKIPLQVVVICGRSALLQKKANIMKKKYQAKHLVVKGYTKNMEDYLYTCDVSAGKTGLNSIFESIYMKKPFLPLFSMKNEQIGKAYMLKKKYAIACNTKEDFITICKKIATDKQFLKPYINRLKKSPVRFGSQTITNTILEETLAFKKNCLRTKKSLLLDFAGTLCSIDVEGKKWDEINKKGMKAVFNFLEISKYFNKKIEQKILVDFIAQKKTLRKKAKENLLEFPLNIQLKNYFKSLAKQNASFKNKLLKLGGDVWQTLESLYVEAECDAVIPYPKLLPTLQSLQKKYSLYLITNNVSSILVDKMLKKCKIEKKIFKKSFISCELGVRKPHRGFWKAILKQTGTKAKDCVVIGDRLTQDNLMAYENNVASIHMAIDSHEDNLNANHIPYTIRVRSLAELKQTLA